MLSINNLCFNHSGAKDYILKDISFSAEKSSITTILGPNGSGKTTLFRCIAGLWKQSSGEISFDGKSIDRLSFRNRARIFSLVPQDHEPPFPYSVLDVVLMGRAFNVGIFSAPGKRDYEIAEEAISTVGIEHIKNKPYTKISGGERQLTLIARALTQKTPVMLLDEPTSHLDFRNQIRILKKLREIVREKGLILIMTLHDPNLAMLFSDKIVVINSGIKIEEGLPDRVMTEELIEKVYGIKVKKARIDGQSIILPLS